VAPGGVHSKHLFLIGLFRRRLEYPALKRAEQQNLFNASVVLIEDKATGQPSEQTSQAMSAKWLSRMSSPTKCTPGSMAAQCKS
jgi:hypothetical protein